jgi:hypothetical protein
VQTARPIRGGQDRLDMQPRTSVTPTSEADFVLFRIQGRSRHDGCMGTLSTTTAANGGLGLLPADPRSAPNPGRTLSLGSQSEARPVHYRMEFLCLPALVNAVGAWEHYHLPLSTTFPLYPSQPLWRTLQRTRDPETRWRAITEISMPGLRVVV